MGGEPGAIINAENVAAHPPVEAAGKSFLAEHGLKLAAVVGPIATGLLDVGLLAIMSYGIRKMVSGGSRQK